MILVPGYWVYSGPTGDPGVITLNMQLSGVSGGLVGDYPITIPLSIYQTEAMLTAAFGTSFTGTLAALDTWRTLFRTTFIFVVGLVGLGIGIQELRV